jgi:hypothetical protein
MGTRRVTPTPVHDRRETSLDAICKAKIAEALSDSRPSVPLEIGLARLRARITRSQG